MTTETHIIEYTREDGAVFEVTGEVTWSRYYPETRETPAEYPEPEASITHVVYYPEAEDTAADDTIEVVTMDPGDLAADDTDRVIEALETEARLSAREVYEGDCW